ncbi:MAG: hypothetical protein GYB41_05805 [Oceanospirillales bacterium]|uniref:Mutator family transposase n=1 Tax=Marinobacterium halophilum TaxID=267374 RepID=A0A2P8ER16_9GAMM|nr:hypothetical protein [Oceanospirillales bacterium]PSL11916.1 hypothetical protein CLV44_12124 [Marinobacterium halophilum]
MHGDLYKCVEAGNRQFPKLIKTKSGFTSKNASLKLLNVGILKASEKWMHPVQNWNLTLSQLSIHFEGRIDECIDL